MKNIMHIFKESDLKWTLSLQCIDRFLIIALILKSIFQTLKHVLPNLLYFLGRIIVVISMVIFLSFKNIFIYFGCAGFSLLHRLFSRCCKQGLLSSCGVKASHCSDFFCWGVTGRMGFSSCGTQAQLPCSMWTLPGPGIEPMSPALADGFSTTELPGKPLWLYFVSKSDDRLGVPCQCVSEINRFLCLLGGSNPRGQVRTFSAMNCHSGPPTSGMTNQETWKNFIPSTIASLFCDFLSRQLHFSFP